MENYRIQYFNLLIRKDINWFEKEMVDLGSKNRKKGSFQLMKMRRLLN